MIYAVALTALVASSAVGASPTTLSNMMKGKSVTKKIHDKKVADLVRAVQAAPREAVAADFDKRALLDNSGFLNFAYSSDTSCDEDPYQYAGLGMGSCIQDGDSTGSYMMACTGPDAAIDITYLAYSNGDCSGTPTMSNYTTDGTCGVSTNADDDKFELDDRVNFDDDDDDFLHSLQSLYGSYSYTCAATKQTNSVDLSNYDDDTCDFLTGYWGLNINACVPSGFNGIYFLIDSCGEFTYYSDDQCATMVFLNDDGDDDDDTPPPQNTCIATGDDDTLLGQYLIYSRVDTDCSSSGDDDSCFAGSETVLLESGVTKAISDVEVGDMAQVVSADGSLAFSEVVFLPHGANTQKATFSDLELASGNSLRATPAHFVLAGACGADAFELTAMKDIAEGSCVQTANGEDEVTGNGLVVDHGIYTIVTKESSGLVVVNGIRASSFAHNHWLVNNYYNIHRAVYEVAPSLMKNRDVVAANLIVGDIALSL